MSRPKNNNSESKYVVLAARVTASFHKRARAVSKIYRKDIAQMIRDGLLLQIESLEEKHRREQQLMESDRNRLRRRLAPTTFENEDAASITSPKNNKNDDLAKIYEQNARLVISVGKNSNEIRRIAASTVKAIRRQKPLLPPPEHEILKRLEDEVARLRGIGLTEAKTYDNFVESIIDPDNVKTYGDIQEDNEEVDSGDETDIDSAS